MTRHDDLGRPVPVPQHVRRVASLVPSLTETIAAADPALLVAATDWCTHPAGLDVTRIGGTKNPNLATLRELRPDLVVANEEENRPADLAALRAAGLAVWVTHIRNLDQAWMSLSRVLTAIGADPAPDWLTRARAGWEAAAPRQRRRAVVPVWRRPWMVLGSDTFAGDMLARLGVDNVYAGHADRYPRVPLDELRTAGADLVVLPDEPYPFAQGDGPESFPDLPAALVSGRHLTWYGPSLADAPGILSGQLAAAAHR